MLSFLEILTSLWRNVTTCVPTNNPIIYIKNVFNIMPIWKYIHAVCVKPISCINVVSLSSLILNLQFVFQQQDSGGKVLLGKSLCIC